MTQLDDPYPLPELYKTTAKAGSVPARHPGHASQRNPPWQGNAGR